MDDWTDLTRRASFASHRLLGWIFWDPLARDNLAALGVPDGLGHYIVNRGAPLAMAGADVVTAAFYSIRREFVHFAINHASPHINDWCAVTAARDAAVLSGLREMTPQIIDPLGAMAPALWDVVDSIPGDGRVLFAAHRAWSRPDEPVLSAWNALNCIREWRGDTHWAILINDDIGAVEAGLLHDAWMGYPTEWIPRSRGADDEMIARALESLARRGWVTDGKVNEDGVRYREEIEARTDSLCALPWTLLGSERTRRFLDLVEPVGDVYVERINRDAGDNWMPAARPRRR